MTDLRKKLLDMAIEATGDKEITVAGDFEPKGLTWKRAAGGGRWRRVGRRDRRRVGCHRRDGRCAARDRSRAPQEICRRSSCMAASPTKLYLFTTNNAKGIILAKSLIKLRELERDHLTFEMKQKVTVRTVVITDESTGGELKMEGRRYIFHHMNAILDALAGGTEDEDEPATTDAT